MTWQSKWTEKRNPHKPKAYRDFSSDPAGTQTQDLQNRNLTLYSLSYGAEMRCKSRKKLFIFLMLPQFFMPARTKCLPHGKAPAEILF